MNKLFDDPCSDPARYERVLDVVRRTLRDDWDPIGVVELSPTAYDEYDQYAPRLATMLMHGVSDTKIDTQFQSILERMSISNPDTLRRAAEIRTLLRDRAQAAAGTGHD